ncbi:ATP-dependent nuclease [Candidatus Palauibacter sp.]|uniref:ATP-dependent nuclease n=1 Tax=Candidatus Palauibacter sp. TaxID=3101350 RepID=UPI003B01E862
MRITAVHIENFRGIRSLGLELGRVTVLIGENNSGKTSVLDALRRCLQDLGHRRRVVFEALDFHLPDTAAEPSTADPIKIDVTFSDQPDEEWDDALVARLNRARVLQVDDDGRNHVRLRVECQYEESTREFAQDWSFLDLNGGRLSRVPARALATLQDALRYYYLTALRDAGSHFSARGRFWRPFLNDSQLSPDRKNEIESRLQEVNDLVVSSHASFEQVRTGLRRVQSIVPLASGEAVSIEAVPGRMFDMLARAQVQLGTTTGAKIPLVRHGEGTQSLAVLMLFSAFLEAQKESAAVLALEEPEAHLHPSAIRALWTLVGTFRGQQLISTHSGDLLAEVDVHDVRRLARTPEGIKSFRVAPTVLSPEETRKFNYQIRRARGALLFARCWLLVEGETETWIYPAAARALGLNLHAEGIRLVEFSQSDVGMLAKIANALGILWYCVGDDDANRTKEEPKLRRHLEGAREADRFAFPYPDIEVNLLRNGYENVYGGHMSEQNLNKILKTHGEPGYWQDYAANLPRRAKTRAAAEVAIRMEGRGEAGVSPEIREVLEKVVSLARGDGP